jgi:hypothetical protein
MIKLYMNSVHAARGVDVRQAAPTKGVVISGAENIESRIRDVHAVRVGSSAVYRVEFYGIVLVEKITSLDSNDFYERTNRLAIRVGYRARRSQPAFGVSGAFCLNAWVEDATTFRSTPKGGILAS